jgi:hypothetical protein
VLWFSFRVFCFCCFIHYGWFLLTWKVCVNFIHLWFLFYFNVFGKWGCFSSLIHGSVKRVVVFSSYVWCVFWFFSLWNVVEFIYQMEPSLLFIYFWDNKYLQILQLWTHVVPFEENVFLLVIFSCVLLICYALWNQNQAVKLLEICAVTNSVIGWNLPHFLMFIS